MGRTKSLLVALFVIGFLSAGAGVVSAQRWEDLGTKDVSDRPESDEIDVRSFEGQLRRIRFSTAQAPARFYLARIIYRSGERHYIPMGGQLVQPGGYTRQYDLRGNDRYIKNIHIFVEAAGRPGQIAKVTAWGLQ
ncbi:MAG TPA: hypothetical protein VJ781_04550 [Pyrinomonadaceae bacterium]|nr:hypothetical protein [Pyrinomonadaceae bacterium]